MTMRGATTAAAAFLAAAALLVTGCSGGGDDGKAEDATAQRSASYGPEPSPSGGAGSTKKVPEAELTPATGSFTEKQKEYLVGRVPKGMDPAAVLQAGQDACQRIGRTAKVDEKAARSAIESGQIAGAKAAITHLCPQYKDLLR